MCLVPPLFLNIIAMVSFLFFNLTILLTHSNYDGEELKIESHLANFSDIF